RLRRAATTGTLRELLPTPRLESRGETMLLAAVLLLALAMLTHVLLRPITSYDSLAYHLPTMGQWYQTGSLVKLQQFYLEPSWGFPYGWELVCSLLLVATGSDVAVALPNVVAWVILGLSVYVTCLRLGAGPFFSKAGAVLLLAVPAVVDQVNAIHADMPMATFLMAGFCFALSFVRTRARTELALFMLSLGLACGVKTSALPYAALLAGVLVVLEGRRLLTRKDTVEGPTTRPGRWPVWVPLIGAALAMLLCVPWYLRNYLESGNPLDPMRVQLFGVVLFEGRDPWRVFNLSKTLLAFVFDATSLRDWGILVLIAGYFLQLPFLLMLAQMVLVVVRRVQGRLTGFARGPLLGVTLLVVMTGLLYWFTPLSGDHGGHNYRMTPWAGQSLRYGLCFVSLLAVAAALAGAAARTPSRWVVAGVLVSTALGLFRVGWVYLAVFGTMGAGTYGVATRTRLPERLLTFLAARRSARRAAVVLLLVALTGSLWVARRQREVNRLSTYGPIVTEIERQTVPGERIGYLKSHQSWLLYGRHVDRRVVYVDPGSATLAEWVARLRREDIRVVALGPLPKGWRSGKGSSWLESRDGPFEPLFIPADGKGPSLYRLRDASKTSPSP
ncbi:MAG TPA: phospholipid carrier-dependent glycosyltransferase, partial [Planctomycetota bacterium]|nr:phospholipid carrier-dependent glycosyltransferase [Planctomycetota bacterium]